MNNLKKIGLSALAGSMALATSAQAFDAAVMVESQGIYSSAEGNQTDVAKNGKGIAVDTDIHFTGSGELDMGWTVSVSHVLDTTEAVTNSSTQMAVGMGSMGTVQFNMDGGAASNAIDDVLPKAYEESWDPGVGTASFHAFGSAVSKGSISYKTPSFELPFGVTLSAAADYDPNANVAQPSPASVGADGASGEAFVVKLAHESGLTLGGGNMTVGNTDAVSYTKTVDYLLVTKRRTKMLQSLKKVQQLEVLTQKVMVSQLLTLQEIYLSHTVKQTKLRKLMVQLLH